MQWNCQPEPPIPLLYFVETFSMVVQHTHLLNSDYWHVIFCLPLDLEVILPKSKSCWVKVLCTRKILKVKNCNPMSGRG